MNVLLRRALSGSLLCSLASLVACGGSTPPPKTDDVPVQEPTASKPRSGGGGPSIQQELGSIDPKAVEKTFAGLQSKLEKCHTEGRDRVEYLSGDVKVFLRIDADGKVRYGWFEESSLGDRETEKCIFDVFKSASWPKPQGGEAEVRNGFGWPGGSERAPTSWSGDKVTGALDEAKDVKKSVEKCKHGVSGSFKLTAYVELDESEHADAETDAKERGAKTPAGKAPKKGAPAAGGAKKDKAPAGRFKAIGIVPPSKEGAEKVDCIVDALKPLELPSPGSYAAKVSFSL